MLKSTHQPLRAPEPPQQAPLPAGWTEHKAPLGHSYYYNAASQQSTYTRPVHQPPPANELSQDFLSLSQTQDEALINRNAFRHDQHGDIGASNGAISRENWHQARRKPLDRPKHRYIIPACAPWILIETRLRRRFVHNTETRESLWRFPEDVMKAVVDWDVQRMKDKQDAEDKRAAGTVDRSRPVDGGEASNSEKQNVVGDGTDTHNTVHEVEDELASDEEYEEVEVTDDEDDEAAEPKRPRLQGEPDDNPVDFDEDDIAWQLEGMRDQNGDDDWQMDHGDRLDGDLEDELSPEDAKALFVDLLNDHGVNPYRTWDQVIDDGRIIDDDRYLALPNMRSRREAFDEWSRATIQERKEERAREARKDPRIPYMSFLEKHASPKLYWPEFKRKFRKEVEMRDGAVSDKDREKWYREYVKRQQLPEAVLKSDLSALLKAQPLSVLNSASDAGSLDAVIITDLRYVSLRAEVRTPLLEAYISTLGPPPVGEAAEDGNAEGKRERERRDQALAARERSVREAKRRQERELEHDRHRLRAEERVLEHAMNVGKEGWRAQLGTVEGGAE